MATPRAMCAEPDGQEKHEKRKTKWSLDPRNTFWSNDKNRFGYRMLEKMGWIDGKGLGINEDGKKEHIKIQKKDNNLGVGAKRSNDDEWISHQDSFNDLLSQLNTVHTNTSKSLESETNSLQNTASKSKKLHYHKFIKSKDLSMKSDADLACVFGRRQSKRRKTHDECTSVQQDKQEEHDFHGVTTVKSSLDINQYFALKQEKCEKDVTSTTMLTEQYY